MSEEELKKELKHILDGIMKPELSREEAEELAERWAVSTAKVMRRYGVEYGEEEMRRLKERNLEKIRALRNKMGLE